ncbi:hypothetical protein BAE44_0003880 [Dichanthelium oligosanthes]|uniref:HMA domain-containing protein n=1 Tax=Dichanthelium oligosanthes TaxID=888268 RepID=A0A1E5WCK5_9POAL|nr:hypothetical protein BAE44_0003880 [Dichanthelium oligosanthes]
MAIITGDAGEKLEVVGEGIDVACLVKCLRKKVGYADILQVEEVKDKKAEEKKKPEEPKAPQPVAVVVHPPPPSCCCPGYCNCNHYPKPPLMMQKIDVKVQMSCDKCRQKALALAASAYGVQSVGIEGEEQDQLVVIGDDVDAANLTSCLRKKVKVGSAELIQVEAVVPKEVKKPADETAAGSGNPIPVAEWPPQWCYPYRPAGYYCPRAAVVYPYAGNCYIEDCSNEGSWCNIM